MSDESTPVIIAGRYQLGKRLARGGMGTVFYGHDQQTNEQVAIKRLDWDQIADEPHVLQRFVREGELLAKLAHPNIVRVLTSCQEAEHYYLVMELVEGGTLRDLMAKSHPLAIDHILDLALQIADALAFAHQHQIVHRDLKPANVLLASDGQARLTDFGCALLLNASRALTSTGLVIGTLNYLSPEACRGLRQDARADLWSFGVMLYQMLTNTLPFDGDNMVAVINAILSQPAPDSLVKRPDAPKPLADLIRRLLVKDREQRLTSATQLITILKSIQQGDVHPPDLSAYTAISKPQSRLPAQSTSFVGRDYEIEEFASLLTTQDCRLLTLIGPGGMGKTRLSIEIARAVMSAFPNGVYFVSLAPLDSPHLIPSTIAEALQFTFYGGVEGEKPPDPVTQLVNYLEQKTALLVLDNFEHLLDGVDIVTRLLAGAPGLKIIVTSREVLNIEGEWRRPVEGLPFPENQHEAEVSPNQFSALMLFAERARLIQSDFRLEENLEAVVVICKLVEGMPLAIELAAGWLWMMPIEEIVAEINTGLDFLVSNRRETSERHKSLRVVFESSWRLLEPEGQLALSKLSVFRGGFLRDAAAAMGIRLPVLSRLADKSLVAPPKNGRYGLHELLRQYAEEKLREDEALYQDARTLHSRHYLGWLARLEPNLKCARQLEALKSIDKELDNIRVAWNWAVETQAWSDLKAAEWSVFIYAFSLSKINDVVDLFEQAISALEHTSRTIENRILIGLLYAHKATMEEDRTWDKVTMMGFVRKALESVEGMNMNFDVAQVLGTAISATPRVIGSVSELERIFRECLETFRTAGDRFYEAFGLAWLGWTITMWRNPIEGVPIFEQSLVILRELGEVATRARLHYYATSIPLSTKQQTLEHLQMSTDLWNSIGNRMQIGRNLNHLGFQYLHDAPAVAEVYYLESLAIGRDLGNIPLISHVLDSLAEARFAQGDIVTARQFHLERIGFCEKQGLKGECASAILQLGKLAQTEGNLNEAESYYQQSKARHIETGWVADIIYVQCALILMWLEQTPIQMERTELEWVQVRQELKAPWDSQSKILVVVTQAHRLAAQGRIEQAIEFCGLVINSPFNRDRITDYSPSTKERAELLLQRLQADLSPDVVEAALQRGAALDLDKVFQSLMN
ncbi:MAG: hypothetical protein BroJett018_51770 [Chloroflexota bacterium]|nr:hypothetical protein [Chloroflexota bacterium]NOG66036.1 protein kinase [Chloroflexota bacterium]GIK67383.1 MAG: hypothetical protein BroJett018_51770 [Chloroflexota bacterium]